MASKDYTLNWSDDSLKPPFVLYHTTIDKSTTSLDLTGKDSALWGECIQEDLLRLLENFASHGTPPRAPTIGQFWYNADTGVLGIWNGTTWFPVYTPVPAPVWITPESISYTSGETFTFQASNATTYNVVSGSIPGATFTNGVLSGIATSGNYTITIRATGAGGFTDKKFNVLILAVTTTTTTTTTSTTPFPTSSSTTTTTTTTSTTPRPTTTTTTTTTTTLPVCNDVYESHLEGRYVKSVVRYANGTIAQDGMLLAESFQTLNSRLNTHFKSIVGRPMEYAATVYYYGIYRDECARRGVAYTPAGDIDNAIINESMIPLMQANYNNYEAGFGKINYVDKYCAAKSAGII